MGYVSRFIREKSEPTMFGKGYDAQFAYDGRRPEPLDEESLSVWRDVGYDADAPGDPLRQMDVFRPADDDRSLPVFVFLHGGGWRAGDKRDTSNIYENLAVKIARRGWVVANVNYRLAPSSDWRVQVADAARAVAFIARDASEFGGDGSRLVLSGHSAGAHLVALLATSPRWLDDAGVPANAVRGIAPISGVFDIADFAASAENRRWMVRPAFGEDADAWADASPLSWVSSDVAPFYIVVGEDDEPRIIDQADRFGDLLEEAGVSAALVSMPGVDHFSVLSAICASGYQLVDYLATFADTVVGGKRAEHDFEAAESEARKE